MLDMLFHVCYEGEIEYLVHEWIISALQNKLVSSRCYFFKWDGGIKLEHNTLLIS